MSSEQLLKLIQAQPFQPFRIHMANGRTLDIHHRDFILRAPSGRTAAVVAGDDSFEIIDLGLVTSLEVVNGAPVKGS